MNKILYLKKSNKKLHGGQYFYSAPGGVRYNYREMIEEIKAGEVILMRCFPELEYLSLLKTTEKDNPCKDVQLLNRIIRGGGFVEYINKLEKK